MVVTSEAPRIRKQHWRCTVFLKRCKMYGIVGFNVPLDTLLVILETILQVR